MFQTAFTYNLTRFARILSLPERLQHTPLRNLSLEPLRQRNTALDAFFYDIKVVTPEEAFYISDSLAAVGSILIVPPSEAGSLTLCDTLDEFFLRGGTDVSVLALAGAGGSALGAAAFARNVANAIGKPVATVVPGYGLADALGEAMGGSFLFGWLGHVRHGFESIDEMSGRPHYGVDPEKNAAAAACKDRCRDMQTVLALLADPRAKIALFAAHSRGNGVLAEALKTLKGIDAARVREIADTARIVTFGGKIAMPPVFTRVVDVIGQWDWYGEMNSQPFIATDRKVSGAWHHTNTDIPGHIDVTNVLREILAAEPLSEPVKAKPAPVEAVAEPEPPQAVHNEAAPTEALAVEAAPAETIAAVSVDETPVSVEPEPLTAIATIETALLAEPTPQVLPMVVPAPEKPRLPPKNRARRGKPLR